MEKKVPIRTCVVCKKAMPKKELNRIVKSENGIFFDSTGKKNGRGAYICNDPNCFMKLKKNKLLNRIYQCEIEDSVYDDIERDFFANKK